MMPSQTRETFNKAADRFDAIYTGRGTLAGRLWDDLTRENVRWRMAFALEMAGDLEDKRVLDVGCGSGRLSVAAAHRGAWVTGIDFAEQMVQLARNYALVDGVEKRCRFVHVSLEEFASDKLFDVVVANGFFDYVASPAAAFAAVRRLTAGIFIGSFPLITAPRAPFRKAWRTLHGCHVELYSRRSIQRYAIEAGFSVTALLRHGPIAVLVAR